MNYNKVFTADLYADDALITNIRAQTYKTPLHSAMLLAKASADSSS